MRNLLFIAFSFIAFSGFGQRTTPSINDFQYAVVPARYDFQKSENQYRINTLVKYLLEKEGFTVFLESDQPSELVKEPCKGLQAILDDRSNLFSTKVVLSLRDCYGNVVFESREAKSKIKDYEASYHDAIRMSFSDLAALDYAFVPGISEEVTAVSQSGGAVPVSVQTPESVAINEMNGDTVLASGTPVETQMEVVATLYAQAIDNGYQLVDTTPAIRFRVKNTSRPNTFTIEGVDGLFYRDDQGNWIAEYYKDGVLVAEVYRVKF